MFVRAKKRGSHTYLMLVENRWCGGKVKQRVLASLGWLDVLRGRGHLDGLLLSLERFSDKLALLGAAPRGEGVRANCRKIGAGLVFDRLWRELGVGEVLGELVRGRRFEFSA